MKKCLCRLRALRTAGFTFGCLPVATVPKEGIPQRTSCILADPQLTGPKPFLPLRLFLSSKRYAETLSLFVERFTQTGIPAVLCLAKRLFHPSHQNQMPDVGRNT
jgi:hypothetical protein